MLYYICKQQYEKKKTQNILQLGLISLIIHNIQSILQKIAS